MKAFAILSAGMVVSAIAGPYAPSADLPGSTAIAADSTAIIGWASGSGDLIRGPVNISNSSLGIATHGSAADALGPADADAGDPFPVVSLGDGGSIVLTFSRPIMNGTGADFAVFENGITDQFLELAFVDVSSDGIIFFRFPSVSLTQTATQIGTFDESLNATDLYNLAGKYRVGFGTPFDLADLSGTPGLNLDRITHVRIQDVVGSINPLYGTRDSRGYSSMTRGPRHSRQVVLTSTQSVSSISRRCQSLPHRSCLRPPFSCSFPNGDDEVPGLHVAGIAGRHGDHRHPHGNAARRHAQGPERK